MDTAHAMKLFSLNANQPLAEKMAQHLGMPLGKLSCQHFSDGEIQVNIEETVRGIDVYILQSTSYPVNTHLWELLIMIDACKRASANSITVVIPYFGYARQDRKAAPREPITAKLVADMLVKSGVDHVVTLDLHTAQVQGFFDIPVDNLFTTPLFAQYYRDKGLFGDDIVVVSPKNSGVKRARSLASLLEAPIAIVDDAEDENGEIHPYIIGNVTGKTAVLIDDILNTGETFARASALVQSEGAAHIYAVASHALFTNDAKTLLDAAPIEEILVTDSINCQNPIPNATCYLSASDLLADAITYIHERRPVSPLFTYTK